MDFPGNTSQGPRSLMEITTTGYAFRWTQYLSTGFRAFGNEFGIYVAFTLVYIAISMGTGLIPYIGSTIGLFVNPVLIGGFIFYGRAQFINDHRDFNTFFAGFRQPHWIALVMQSLMANFLLIVTIGASTLPLFYDAIVKFFEQIQLIETLPQDEVGDFIMGLWNRDLTIAFVVAVVVGLVVSTLICLAPYFIVYRSLTFVESIQASFQVVKKRFWGFIGLMITLWLVLILGIMLCCVGF